MNFLKEIISLFSAPPPKPTSRKHLRVIEIEVGPDETPSSYKSMVASPSGNGHDYEEVIIREVRRAKIITGEMSYTA